MQFIQTYKKAFDDDFCDEMIEFFNLSQELGFTTNRQDFDDAKKYKKQDEVLFIPDCSLLHIPKKLVFQFNKRLWECYGMYNEKFDILSQMQKHQIYSMKMQKTKPGQGYHEWHMEANDRLNSNRILTWSIYLNDNFEAGETEFLYQQYRYKPQKGDCLIFPSSFCYTHRGNPPIGGDKYIITGWIEF